MFYKAYSNLIDKRIYRKIKMKYLKNCYYRERPIRLVNSSIPLNSFWDLV